MNLKAVCAKNAQITFAEGRKIMGVVRNFGNLTTSPGGIEYRVDAIMTIKRTKTYSPEMKSYRRWYENICNILSGYDWGVVDKKIEKSLHRDAISKALGWKGM